MNLYFVAITLETLGTIAIAYTALRVHMKIRKDHAVDDPVVNEIRHEEVLAVMGILLIVVGYFIQILIL